MLHVRAQNDKQICNMNKYIGQTLKRDYRLKGNAKKQCGMNVGYLPHVNQK